MAANVPGDQIRLSALPADRLSSVINPVLANPALLNPNLGLRLNPGPAGNVVVDNGPATNLFVPNRVLPGIIPHPFKTVVVDQDPPAGTQVPLGTAVNLTMARVDDIPLSVLAQDGGLSAKFANLGALQTEINQPANAALKTALANAGSVDALSPPDLATFKAFVANANPQGDATQAFQVARLASTL